MSYGWEEDGFIEEAMLEACGTTNIWTFIDEFNRMKTMVHRYQLLIAEMLVEAKDIIKGGEEE